MQADTAQIRENLKIHITGKLTPSIADPVHLRQELLQINKQLATRCSLPEDPMAMFGIIIDSWPWTRSSMEVNLSSW